MPNHHQKVNDQARAALQKATGPGPDCLSMEQLAALAEATDFEAAPPEHVAGCPYCRTEVTWMREALNAEPTTAEAGDVAWITANLPGRLPPVEAETVSSSQSVPTGQRPNSTWWTRLVLGIRERPMAAMSWAGAMACILLAVGIGLRPADDFGLLEEGGSGVVRSARLELVSPLGDLNALPKELSWQAFGGAQRYEVEVSEVDASVVWRGEFAALSVAMPSEVVRLSVPGKTLHWKVSARDSEGKLLAESEIAAFRVAIEEKE